MFADIINNDSKWLIFSDTILVTMRLLDDEKSIKTLVRWVLFLNFCEEIQKYMFTQGLPVRGVIHVGDYLIVNQCFAGHPIVEAYKLVSELDLSVCIMSEDAHKEFKEFGNKDIKGKPVHTFFERYFTKYLVPLKGGKEAHFFTLNYYEAKKTEDIRQTVLEAFWKHNKDISKGVQIKIENTEQHVRHLYHFNKTKT